MPPFDLSTVAVRSSGRSRFYAGIIGEYETLRLQASDEFHHVLIKLFFE
jgi:hypothetical protein